ncbi:MAG: FAD-dependent oxidoreductase [Balneolia bacterium]|nr:FAD-dependent oxidoreductase [Balneolia bacterium]
MSSKTPKSDIIIIGGGLAGSFTALSLCEMGLKCTLIHSNSDTRSAASMVPLALYNPAAALRAQKGWMAEECAKSLQDVTKKLEAFASGSANESFYADNGVIRPALDSEMEGHFRKSFEQEEWPEGWISWMNPDEISKKYPEVENRFSGLHVHSGKTYDTPKLLHILHTKLAEEFGCLIIDAEVSGLQQDDDYGWSVITNKTTYQSKNVLLAAGSGSFGLSELKDFKLHQVKGQAIEIEKPVSKGNYPSVSSKGYIAILGERAVVGSTYEHHFNDLQTTEKGEQLLQNKVTRTFPNREIKEVKVKSAWAGIRITTPDRMPLMGQIPGKPGLFLSVGFGSKGMMYAPYCGELLARHIVNGAELPFEVSLKRQLPPSD